MYNSIQHFLEYGIPQLEENQKFFMENPSCLGEYAVRVKKVMLELGCQILSEMVGECNTMLEDSVKRRIHWQIKDRCEKHLLISLGTISFTHTRFEHKTTGEKAYLLDRILGLSPIPVSVRMQRQACWKRRRKAAMKKPVGSQEGKAG